MLKLLLSEKGNQKKNRDNGKTIKFNKRKKTKLWNSKDSRKLDNKGKYKRLEKFKP